MKGNGKVKVVNKLMEEFRNRAFVVVNFKGIPTYFVNEFKNTLKKRKINGRYFVARNTLVSIALKNLGLDDIAQRLKEENSYVVFNVEDTQNVLKVVSQMSKSNKNFSFKFGYLYGKFMNGDEIEKIAELPSKEELLAALINVLRAPVIRFLNDVNYPLRRLVFNLKAMGG